MPTLITAGIDYPQFFDDLRAVIRLRHELQQHAATTTTSSAATNNDELLSISEAAEMLGITVQTVYEHKRRGLLKYHKLGSRSYLKRAEVLAALQSQQRSKK